MAKEIILDAAGRAKLLAGLDQVADAVKITLGPKGRNAVLEKKFMTPLVTNDGATIAGEITLEDGYEDMGAQLIREVASKTNDVAGDGTTTAVVLAQAMVHAGMKNLAAGANPVLLRRGMEQAVAAAVTEIDALAQPVQSSDEIRQVVLVSSEDEEVGDLLSQALQQVNDGNGIVVENSQTLKSSLEVQQGFSFERGYVSANMINQPDVSQCVYEDVDILLIDKKFKTMSDIYPILELSLNRKKPLLMIVDELEEEALQIVNMNNARGILSVVAVQGPTHGENRQRELLDMEAMVGGQAIVGEVIGMVDQVTEAMLGHADRVVVEKNKTTIVGGTSDAAKVQSRIAMIHDEMQEYKSGFVAEVCQSRLSRLAGNTVVLKVGASTEAEYNEKKLRIEDALHAANAAMKDGIVVGGGVTYLRVLDRLATLCADEDDVNTGIDVIRQALQQPLAQIAINAGKEPSVIVEAVRKLPQNEGYHVLHDRYENLYDAGVIEPAKVVKAALQNAASMAMMALTVEAVVGEAPKQDDEKQEK